MSKVYVVSQQTGFDMSSALDFGEAVTLFPSGTAIYLDADEFVRIARRKLSAMEPEDYLLLAGDPVAMGIAFAVAAEVTGGFVRVLKWDRRKGPTGGYRVVPVNLEAQPD